MNNSRILRFLVTIILLGILSLQINFKEVSSILIGLEKLPLIIAIFLVFGSIVLSAYKWQLLLVARGWQLSLISLTKVYFVGLFANNFLPSSIGGDMLRVYKIGKTINNYTEATASVILERLLATIGLTLPVLVAVLPNQHLLGKFTYTVFGFLVFCLSLIMIILKPNSLSPLSRITWNWWQKLIAKLKDISHIMQEYRSRPGTILMVIGYSVIFQLSIVLINYYLLKAMKIDTVSLWQCVLIIPIISALSMIPISINGLGIREGSYVLLLTPLGVTSSQAITISLLFFLIVTVVSFIGGGILLLERDTSYLDGREITQ